MRRTAGKIPSYRHHKARNLAVVTLDGRNIYLGKFDSPESRREYDRVIQEWLAAGRHAPAKRPARPGRPDDPGASLTVNEVLARYWAFAQDFYTHDGERGGELHNIKAALRPLRRVYGATPADDFGPKSLKALRRGMIEEGLARNTINSRVGKIKRMFKWAVSEELVSPLVYQGLDTVDGLQAGQFGARETAPVRPVEPEQVAAVLPYVSAPIRAMIQLQDLAGMRPGEVMAMRSGEVDRSGEVWVYRPARHKTQNKGFARSIPLGPRAQAILAPWLRDDPDAYVFQPAEGMAGRAGKAQYNRPTPRRKRVAAKGAGAAAYSGVGKRYGSISYYSAIARGCDYAFLHPTLGSVPRKDLTEAQAAELRAWRKAHRWHPNQLRHAAATRIRREFGLEAAQVTLGHAKADTTQIYAERDMAKAVEVAKAIG